MWSDRVEEALDWLKQHNTDPTTGKVRTRKDGKTELWIHSFDLITFAHEVLGADNDDTLIIGVLHDGVEDFAIPIEEIADRYGQTVVTGVLDLTDIKIPPECGLDREVSWQIRHFEKTRRIPGWMRESCLASASDIFVNHTLADRTTLDPLCRDVYLLWSIRDHLPTLDRRLRVLGWEGSDLLGLVAPAVMDHYRTIDKKR